MRAIVFEEHGGVDKLQYRDLPTPIPGPSECLVQVRACGINFSLDLKTRQDGGAWPIKMPHVLGADIAGDVAAVGAGVDAGWIGKRVAVLPWVVCGTCEYCRRGQDSCCVNTQTIGIHRHGGYAEYVVVPAQNLVELPSSLGYAEAAAVPVAFTTAWHMLATRGRVGPADTVLVVGATGGVGVAAVQIAKLHGATVVAVAGDDAKLESLRPFGVDHVINYHTRDLKEAVFDVTAGSGVDLVCETVGTATWATSLAVLRPEGRLVCCGSASGAAVSMDLRPLYRRNLSLLFSHVGTQAETRLLYELIGKGKLVPLVHASYPLEEAARAQEALLERAHVGKLVLSP